VNGRICRRVGYRTVLHQVRGSLARRLSDEGYYFCADPDCEVAYFTDDGRLIDRRDLREPSLRIDGPQSRLVCYCFGFTASELTPEGGDMTRAVLAFIREQTRRGYCACEVRNPSGRCCLAELPGLEAAAGVAELDERQSE
jgi:hypothetical protein